MQTHLSDDGLLPTATAGETWRYAVRLLRPRWALAVLTVLVLSAGTALQLVTPRALGWVVDAAIDGDRGAVVWPVQVLVFVTIAAGVLQALTRTLIALVGEPVLASLREDVLERALRLPAGEVERGGSGDLVARISGDVEVVTAAIRSTVPTLAMSVFLVWMTAVGLAVIDWRFAVVALLALPTDIYALRWYLRRSGPVFAAQRIAEGARAQQLLDSVGGVDTVRAFRLGPDHLRRSARRSEEAVEVAYRAIHFRTRFWGRMHLSEAIGVGVVLVAGFYLVRDGAVSVGAATAAALYFSRLFEPVNMILMMIDTTQEAGAALARLVGVARVAPPPPRERAALGEPSVDVHGVGFAYDEGREILHGVDLAVRAGTWTAVVGSSGAGKTTLVKIISGLYPPAAGEVRLGGVPVGELGPEQLRDTVALVTQEVHVFAGPLIDDLRLARPDASDAEVDQALERAGALSWVAALPSAERTVVGRGGHRLTPTQAQELALARLLLVDAPVVVLDEATADAGSAGARRLEGAARRALDGRTVIVVAHRLTQAAAADDVLVLEQGRVAERGTHDELVAASGRYARMWSAWSSSGAPPSSMDAPEPAAAV
ncbi:multidrug ABC transporter permease [Frankia sp. R43]|uniref:ABC transporter ATP-binding protein n=1 Tax=Frankia sp. R43 TaxID=269536 RepID=UPI0006CA09EB|nr:ABC transporter ATP-binding protein [Frankia sp. R43]KPM55090.1 multidrug ABC transporter permease [Frankia sp. R43]